MLVITVDIRIRNRHVQTRILGLLRGGKDDATAFLPSSVFQAFSGLGSRMCNTNSHDLFRPLAYGAVGPHGGEYESLSSITA